MAISKAPSDEKIEEMRRQVQEYDMARMAEEQKAKEEKMKPLRDLIASDEFRIVRDNLDKAMGADPTADIHLVAARQVLNTIAQL